jgi:hypothetical protein
VFTSSKDHISFALPAFLHVSPSAEHIGLEGRSACCKTNVKSWNKMSVANLEDSSVSAMKFHGAFSSHVRRKQPFLSPWGRHGEVSTTPDCQ